MSAVYGGGKIATTSRLSVTVWIGLIVLAVEAVLYIMAYPGLKAHKKAGWNLLFYAALVNAVYSVVVAFTSYGGAGNIVSGLIGTVIGLYFLFQIRSYYMGTKKSE